MGIYHDNEYKCAIDPARGFIGEWVLRVSPSFQILPVIQTIITSRYRASVAQDDLSFTSHSHGRFHPNDTFPEPR